jgi:hypothetical protein
MEKEALYPFGYGLSYSDFRIAPAQVASKGATVSVRTAVTCCGAVAGETVVQIYARWPEQAGAPRCALVGFQRVCLQPGEVVEVLIDVAREKLLPYGEGGGPLSGPHRVEIAACSHAPVDAVFRNSEQPVWRTVRVGGGD